ncbi:Uncharacterized protein Fot_51665 [Forsythia ovata]|uniref:Uncharacterized protein n=1 Tax=Forsythia ovata TaxID=205694 RepID=A0ABD1PW36_9LAMI
MSRASPNSAHPYKSQVGDFLAWVELHRFDPLPFLSESNPQFESDKINTAPPWLEAQIKKSQRASRANKGQWPEKEKGQRAEPELRIEQSIEIAAARVWWVQPTGVYAGMNGGAQNRTKGREKESSKCDFPKCGCPILVSKLPADVEAPLTWSLPRQQWAYFLLPTLCHNTYCYILQ